MPGPIVSEWVHRSVSDRRRVGELYARAVAQTHPVTGGAGADNGEVPRCRRFGNSVAYAIDDADFGPLFIKVCSYAPAARDSPKLGGSVAKTKSRTEATVSVSAEAAI